MLVGNDVELVGIGWKEKVRMIKKNTLYKRPDKNRWYKILEDLIQMRRNIACENIFFQQ